MGAALLVAGILGFVAVSCSPPERQHALTRRTQTFEQLGAAIARLAPGSTALMVGNPFAVRPGADPALRQVEEASILGLRRGLGPSATWAGVAYPALKPGALENPRAFDLPPGATTPLSFLTAPGAWDRLREAAPSPAPTSLVFVSLIGLPADLAETRAWTDPGGPRWVLYLPDLRLLGSADAIRAAFREQRVLAMVLNRPGAPPESEALDGDVREDFERRCLLVTAANLEESLRAWPQLFPP